MISLKKRINTEQARRQKTDKQVTVAGWIQEIKVMGKIAFAKLRDRSGTIQLVFLKKKFDGFDKLNEITRESVVSVKGKVQESKLKKGGNEILAEELELTSKARTPLPIEFLGKGIETDLSKRLDARFLDLRNPKIAAIFAIREKVIEAIHEFMKKNNFIEVYTPKTSGAGAEGGATLFSMNYFGKSAYLNQSQQVYKQMLMACGFERVYEIGPSFRAEKSHTQRHLTEFAQLDCEMSFIDSEEEVYSLQEKMLKYTLNYVRENCKSELKKLDKKLPKLKLPLPRVTYEQAIKLLKKSGVQIKAGEDIGTDAEKKLGEIIEKKKKTVAYFLTKFPWNLEVCKFYWHKKGKHGAGGDFEFQGQELSTGSQREHDYKKLSKQIRDKGLSPKEFGSYLKPFKFGMPKQGGFGMGIDRLVSYLLKIENIREVVLFPRDPSRLSP